MSGWKYKLIKSMMITKREADSRNIRQNCTQDKNEIIGRFSSHQTSRRSPEVGSRNFLPFLGELNKTHEMPISGSTSPDIDQSPSRKEIAAENK